jgi:hypothetical protein
MKKILFSLAMLLASSFAGAYTLYTPAGTMDVGYANTEGVKASYSASIPAFTPAATATDFITVTGATGKVVTVTSISITGTTTAGTLNALYIYKRSAANTGGTTAAVTPTIHDSLSPAPSSTVVSYSANPSALGAGTVVRSDYLALPSGASGSFQRTYSFTDRAAKGIKLRGTSESIALNWAGAAIPSGLKLFITVEWTEE